MASTSRLCQHCEGHSLCLHYHYYVDDVTRAAGFDIAMHRQVRLTDWNYNALNMQERKLWDYLTVSTKPHRYMYLAENHHMTASSVVLASFPGFIAFSRSKAWDAFTREWRQMTLNWTGSTTTPTHFALEARLRTLPVCAVPSCRCGQS